MSQNGSEIVLPFTPVIQRLTPGQVQLRDPYCAAWEISVGGEDFIHVGTSDNLMYVTLGEPIVKGPLWESVLDLSTRADASYGTVFTGSSTVEAQIDFENASIDGFLWVICAEAGGFVYRQDDPDLKELNFLPSSN